MSSAPDPALDVVDRHRRRGVELQACLRLALVAFVVAALVANPPAQRLGACVLLAAGYLLVAVLQWVWLRLRPDQAVRRGWVLLFGDIVLLGSITVLAGLSAQQSWTAYVVATGFFLVPLLAATQLSPAVSVAVAVPTLLVYLFSVVSTRQANGEPWSSLVVRAGVLLAVCVAGVGLSQIQRVRLRETARLARARAALLVELTDLEERERADLAAALHDGALQYVLAARLDLDDVRSGDADAVARVEQALAESVTLLRSTVGALHPAVMAQAGLQQAVDHLANGLRRRGIAVEIAVTGPLADAGERTDRVAYEFVREALANVVKHAAARSVRIDLTRRGDWLEVTVTDDGVGIDRSTMVERLAAGHLGLASQRLRVEAVGGRFEVVTAEGGGVRAWCALPVPR